MNEASGHKLGDFVEFRNGVNFSQADEGKGIPILKVKDFGSLHSVPIAGFDELDAGKIRIPDSQFLKPKDIVIIRSNGNPQLVGRSLIFAGAPNSVTFSGFCIRARVVRDVALPQFLHYWLRSPATRALFTREGNGTGIQNVSQAYLANMHVSLPDVATQSRMVELLGSLDEKIELNRRMNETLEAMAQAIFRDWFVDFGPTRRKLDGAIDPVTIMGGLMQDTQRAQALADFFPATLGDDGLPEGWNAGRLDELAEVHMGASPKGDTYNEDGIGTPLANGPVEFGDYFLVEKKWTTSPTRLSQVGDFIICVRGSTTGRHVFADGVYCLGRGVAALRGFHGEQDFVNATIIMHLDTLLQKTTGSVFPNLSGDDIRSFSCLVPPKSLRQQFSSLVEPLRMRVWHHIHENRTLAATRDLLLPNLMSGEISLSGAEDLMEAAQ